MAGFQDPSSVERENQRGQKDLTQHYPYRAIHRTSLFSCRCLCRSTNPCINGSNGPDRNESRLLICTRPIMTRPVRFELEWNPPPQSWYTPLSRRANKHSNISKTSTARPIKLKIRHPVSTHPATHSVLSPVLISDHRPRNSRILPARTDLESVRLARNNAGIPDNHFTRAEHLHISVRCRLTLVLVVPVKTSATAHQRHHTTKTETSHQPMSDWCPRKKF